MIAEDASEIYNIRVAIVWQGTRNHHRNNDLSIVYIASVFIITLIIFICIIYVPQHSKIHLEYYHDLYTLALIYMRTLFWYLWTNRSLRQKLYRHYGTRDFRFCVKAFFDMVHIINVTYRTKPFICWLTVRRIVIINVQEGIIKKKQKVQAINQLLFLYYKQFCWYILQLPSYVFSGYYDVISN